MKKTKLSANTLMKEYGMPNYKSGRASLRYKNPIEKGIAWYWFAHFIRKRDAIKWGTCISCGQRKTFEEMDAGHFAPAGDCGLDLLMDEVNVNGECQRCNAWDEAHLWGYEKNLDTRYGTGTASELKKRYSARFGTITKGINWSAKALEYKAKFEKLSTD